MLLPNSLSTEPHAEIVIGYNTYYKYNHSSHFHFKMRSPQLTILISTDTHDWWCGLSSWWKGLALGKVWFDDWGLDSVNLLLDFTQIWNTDSIYRYVLSQAAWMAIEFVHGYCFREYSEDITFQHLLVKAMDSLFSNKVQVRWYVIICVQT